MNPLERFIAMIAPHVCFACGDEGAPLCIKCMVSNVTEPYLCCYRCSQSTVSSYICSPCTSTGDISAVWVSARYAGYAKDLTKQLKFQRVRAAANVMAIWIDQQLPVLPDNIIVCPIPTAARRVRARGYDQASLIAKSLAKRRKLPYKQLLVRITATRQVGANRHDRFQQMQGAYTIRNPTAFVGKRVLIVDDVLTTGSTLESAATTLISGGAQEVWAAVFASQTTEGMFASSTKNDSR